MSRRMWPLGRPGLCLRICIADCGHTAGTAIRLSGRSKRGSYEYEREGGYLRAHLSDSRRTRRSLHPADCGVCRQKDADDFRNGEDGRHTTRGSTGGHLDCRRVAPLARRARGTRGDSERADGTVFDAGGAGTSEDGLTRWLRRNELPSSPEPRRGLEKRRASFWRNADTGWG